MIGPYHTAPVPAPETLAPRNDPVFTGSVAVPPGNSAVPGLHLDGDADTGLFSPGPNTLAAATGGAERMRVDSGGRVLVGATASTDTLPGFSSVLQVNAHTQVAFSGLNFFDNNGTAALALGKSRGGSFGAHAPVLNGDLLGSIWFLGSDGTRFHRGAQIIAQIETSPAPGSLPTRLLFYTTPTGSTTSYERIRISASGAVMHNGSTIVVDESSHLGLRSYTVATLPSAAAGAGRLVYVADGSSGRRLAVSDGAIWRFPDGTIVS